VISKVALMALIGKSRRLYIIARRRIVTEDVSYVFLTEGLPTFSRISTEWFSTSDDMFWARGRCACSILGIEIGYSDSNKFVDRNVVIITEAVRMEFCDG